MELSIYNLDRRSEDLVNQQGGDLADVLMERGISAV